MSECVLWTGPLNAGRRYGWNKGRYAHRVAWEAAHGPIPVGHVVHHVCGVMLCVNVAHLELVTRAAHMTRHDLHAVSADHRRAATHCKRGHAFTAANTYDDGGRRRCRACAALRARLAYWRARAA